MARPYATLFAVLAALALVHTASAQCIAQLDSSTCLLVFGADTSDECLSSVQTVTKGEGCNEYTFLESTDGNVCVLKWEGCDASAVTYSGQPLDTCPDNVVAASEKLTYECSGSGSPSPGTPTPSTPSTGSGTDFVGICTYQGDYCGMIFQPMKDSGLCGDLMASILKGTETDCSAWTYAESGASCYFQYLDDDSSCSGVQVITDAFNSADSSDSFEPNGECDSSLLPSDLTFSDACGGAPSPDAPGTDSTDPPTPTPTDSSGIPSPSITFFTPGTGNKTPPPTGTSGTPPGPPSPNSPTLQAPPGGLIPGAATGDARVGIVLALALLAALAYVL